MSIALPEKTEYIKYPKGLFKNKSGIAERAVSAEIYTFSRGKDKRCNLSYRDFSKKLGLSVSTVARAIKALKTNGRIEQDKSRYSCASYDYTGRLSQQWFVRTDLFLYTTVFDIRGEEPRRLKHSEILVFGWISTHCNNKKRGTFQFTGSKAGIAKTLNMSKSTVQDALSTLLRAELIFRTSGDRGVNRHKQSVYTINANLLRIAKKKAKAEEKQEPQAVREANERAERERFYAQRRADAERKAEIALSIARRSQRFGALEKELFRIELDLARAELRNPTLLPTFRAKKIKLRQEYAAALADVGLTERDVVPQWACATCQDTGYKENGTPCGCYVPGGGG